MGEQGAHWSRWDELEASARTPPPPFSGEGYGRTLQSRGVGLKWGWRIAAACMLLLVQPASPLPLGPGSGSSGYGTRAGELNAPSGCRRAPPSPPASSRSGSPGSGPGEVVSENGGCRLFPLSQGPPPLVARQAAPRGIAVLSPGCGVYGEAAASPVSPRSWQPPLLGECCETGRSGDEEGRCG
jgi:hypothetical protein